MIYPKIMFVICMCAIFCSAQTPSPSPPTAEANERHRQSLLEYDRIDIQSDKPRVRSNQLFEYSDNTTLIGSEIVAFDDKQGSEFPRFEIILGITEKQWGGSEDVFIEIMKSQPPHLPKIFSDILSVPISFEAGHSGFGKGGNNEIPLYFRSQGYRIKLQDEQVDELLRTNSLDFTCGQYKFPITAENIKQMKNFIEHEREIAKFTRIRASSQRQKQPQ